MTMIDEKPITDKVASQFDHYQTRASLFVRLNDSSNDNRNLAWSEFQARYVPIIASWNHSRPDSRLVIVLSIVSRTESSCLPTSSVRNRSTM